MTKFLISFLVLMSLSACGVIECIDNRIDRDPIPIPEAYRVTLEFDDLNPLSINVRCERYYDSMCAERGNYWAIREVGMKSEYQTSKFRIQDEKIGEILVPIPSCSVVMSGRLFPLEHIVLTVNGRSMWLRESDGDLRTYQTATLPGQTPEQIQVRLKLSVNGTSLAPGDG